MSILKFSKHPKVLLFPYKVFLSTNQFHHWNEIKIPKLEKKDRNPNLNSFSTEKWQASHPKRPLILTIWYRRLARAPIPRIRYQVFRYSRSAEQSKISPSCDNATQLCRGNGEQVRNVARRR